MVTLPAIYNPCPWTVPNISYDPFGQSTFSFANQALMNMLRYCTPSRSLVPAQTCSAICFARHHDFSCPKSYGIMLLFSRGFGYGANVLATSDKYSYRRASVPFISCFGPLNPIRKGYVLRLSPVVALVVHIH